MDFLQIVLDGWFNSINRDNLENYFLRSFKKAERDEFLDLKTFSDGCWEAIESLIKLIETKSINKRKQDLYYLLSSANIETVNYAKDELDFINNRGGDMEFSYPITYDGQSYQCTYGEMLQLKRTILKTFISELKKSENQKSESIPAPQQVTLLRENNTTKKITDEFDTLNFSQGWDYAFRSESDYNLFVNLLTNFFEYKPYQMPDFTIEIKKGTKTKIANALKNIHSELSNQTLRSDTDFFKIVRLLNHFNKANDIEIYNALLK